MSFHTTIWSQIEAVAGGDSLATHDFVRRYQPALIQFLRRQGVGSADAEDLTQEVFLRLFQRELLHKADASRARFRSYLCGVTRNVLREHRERAGAQKRGGDAQHVPLDAVGDVPAEDDEDGSFRVCWAEHLLQRALDGLKAVNPRQYETLQHRLDGELPYAEIGARMNRTVPQIKMDVQRARTRLVELVKAEIRAYASSEAEYREELEVFRRLVGRRD